MMSNKMIMPAGKYWIGDPCYVFPHEGLLSEKWDEFLDEAEDFNDTTYVELDDGKIKIWAASTAYGDGSFIANSGKLFSVDAGLIGIVPQETVDYLGREDNDLENLGLFIEFNEPFIVQAQNGSFTFGYLTIDTDEEVEEDNYNE